MRDSRRDGVKSDPRNDSDLVHVRNYSKSDGTSVSEHDRKKPHIKYKLKGRIDEDEATYKGKATLYDKDGKKILSEKIDETQKFSEEQKRKLSREFGKLE